MIKRLIAFLIDARGGQLYVHAAALFTLACTSFAEPSPMNALFVIAPYKYQGMWVFDDERVGLAREPFVSGADDILDALAAAIPGASRGVSLVFSAAPFPGYTARFVLDRPEHGGNWYRWPEKRMEGWLCPALFKYFPTAPEELFVKVKPGH